MATGAGPPFSSSPLVEWGVAATALPGEAELGDGYVVKALPHGVLSAVVDGLGHGEEAATAAKLAVTTLGVYAAESVISLVKRCHDTLRNTRGAVMSLASFNGLDGTVTWLGIGNVEGVLLGDAGAGGRHESLLVRAGVVGHQLPALRAEVVPLGRSGTLILATDGIRSGFAEGLSLSDPPQRLAERILARHCKGTDDALVLVVRYLGRAP